MVDIIVSSFWEEDKQAGNVCLLFEVPEDSFNYPLQKFVYKISEGLIRLSYTVYNEAYNRLEIPYNVKLTEQELCRIIKQNNCETIKEAKKIFYEGLDQFVTNVRRDVSLIQNGIAQEIHDEEMFVNDLSYFFNNLKSSNW